MPTPSAPAVDFLGLSLVAGLSPRQQRFLLEHLGSPRAALDLLSGAAAVLDEAARFPEVRLVEQSLRWAEHPDHHLVTWADPCYPSWLREITDPPLVLYCEGRVDLLASTCFAVVGSRNATDQGKQDARGFARALSEAGLCIVSGLALGIDAAAHVGGLEGGASSIAVIGTGSDLVYPPRNGPLARRLAESGCVVSEFALGTPPLPGNFLRRNRLISGLSRGVLVVEANERSGSLTTARCAADQNREVFALPGSIHSALSKGCHKLIREGAKLVETVNDILVELRLAPRPAGASAATPASPLLRAMGFDPVSMDQLAGRTGLDAAAIAAQLSLLQIEGRVSALPGGRFQRLDGTA